MAPISPPRFKLGNFEQRELKRLLNHYKEKVKDDMPVPDSTAVIAGSTVDKMSLAMLVSVVVVGLIFWQKSAIVTTLCGLAGVLLLWYIIPPYSQKVPHTTRKAKKDDVAKRLKDEAAINYNMFHKLKHRWEREQKEKSGNILSSLNQRGSSRHINNSLCDKVYKSRCAEAFARQAFVERREKREERREKRVVQYSQREYTKKETTPYDGQSFQRAYDVAHTG